MKILKENMLRFGTRNLSESDKAKLNEFEIIIISVAQVEKRKNQGMSLQEIINDIMKHYANSTETQHIPAQVKAHYGDLEKETPEQRKQRYAGYDQETLDYIGSSK
jgi:hypothetical protein